MPSDIHLVVASVHAKSVHFSLLSKGYTLETLFNAVRGYDENYSYAGQNARVGGTSRGTARSKLRFRWFVAKLLALHHV